MHTALRAKKYDEYANKFVKNHTAGIIVNLGCGFDSRYKRLNRKPNLFIDLESFSPNFKFIEDWSYFDEHHPKVGWMNIMGKFNYFKYVQWTVFYRII